MKISEMITDRYKLRIPPTVYYDLLADVQEMEDEQRPKFIAKSDGTIEQIKNCNDCLFKKEWEKIGKLLSVVLEKQTEQEPTTKNDLGVDCISREAVERIINKWLSHSDYELKDHIYSMTEKIHNLPSVTPQLSSGLEKNSKKLEKDFGELDCISRADAIRVASGYCHPSNVAKELAKLPSVIPQEPRWIPVSESLPESDEEYHTFLVTDNKGRVRLSEFYLSISDKKPYWSGMIDVIAWMPLPKPYEPQESEEQE